MYQDQFIDAWKQARSLDEDAARLKELARGTVPRWAATARAMELRRDGFELKALVPPARAPA
jgi:hypothetical protein